MFVLLLFSFLSEVFSFLTRLSSLLGPLGFWLLALPVRVCSLECNNDDNNNNGNDIDAIFSKIQYAENREKQLGEIL